MSQEYQTPGQQTTGPGTGPTTGQWQERLASLAREIESRGRELIAEGNAHRLVVEHNGRGVVNMPLTAAAAIGGAAVIFKPPLAILGVLAALLARVRARIE